MASQVPEGLTFDIGRVIGRAFRTLGRRAPIFIALALLLVGLPTFLTQTYAINSLETGNIGLMLSPLYWLAALIGLFTGYLLQGAVVHASLRDLRGQQVDLGEALVVALKLLLPMIGLTILSAVLLVLGFALLIVPGIIVYIMLIVAVPVLVEERRGVLGSMRRSRELTKGSRWWILLLLILYLVVAGTVGGVATLATRPLILGGSTAAGIVQAVLTAALSLLTATTLASLYIELRSIKEGASESTLAEIFA